jgi:hypothetical protein
VQCEVVERNRARWFEQQKSNSWTFYFSPKNIVPSGQCWGNEGTIAHIMLFINTKTHVRLHLLHSRIGDQSLAIQERGMDSEPLFVIHECDIPVKMESRHFDLPSFDDGKHELEVIAKTSGVYLLEDIVVEFFDDDVKLLRASKTKPGPGFRSSTSKMD